MQKIMVTIDLTKIDKSRIENYEYTDKEGNKHTQKRYKMEVIETSNTKTLKETPDWVLRKTHMVVEGQTKEERAEKKETVFLGDGLQFAKPQAQGMPTDEELADPSSMPF